MTDTKALVDDMLALAEELDEGHPGRSSTASMLCRNSAATIRTLVEERDRLKEMTHQDFKLINSFKDEASVHKARAETAEARIAALTSAEGCESTQKAVADEIYELIEHGDEEHRRWLRATLDGWRSAALAAGCAPVRAKAISALKQARPIVDDCGYDEDPEARTNAIEILRVIDDALAALEPRNG